MSDYSLELAAERIFDARTKRFFAEVLGSYSAGYYRSAVVMLWSVVVTDILFKLDQLSSAYGDATATAILQEIADQRKNNAKSPEWEGDLINKVASRTDLIDHAEVSLLQSLHTHRHLSAHPVLTASDVLFSPNKETARAHIRNALDAVLTKPPIMSRKVFDVFLEDVEQIGQLKPGADQLRKFLEAKYFKHFSALTLAQVFKSLWRVTFRSKDPRAEKNRGINAQALEVIFAQHAHDLGNAIASERDWFSDVSLSSSHLAALVRFLQDHPGVFAVLTEAIKAPLLRHAELSLDNFAACSFLVENPEDLIDRILRKIDEGATMSSGEIARLCRTYPDVPKVRQIGMRLYFASKSYDTADNRFGEMVNPYLEAYDKDDALAFLQGCETCYNAQATDRGRAAHDHRIVKQAFDARHSDIDLKPFAAFRASLRQ